MVGLGNFHQLLWLGNLLEERFHTIPCAVLIVCPLDNQLRLRASFQIAEIRIVHRNAETDQFLDSRVGAAHFQSHHRTEAESGKNDWDRGKFLREVIDRSTNVFSFTATSIVLAYALARAAEIESQYGKAARVQRLRGLKHDFIVHRAAEERMRMANYRSTRRIWRGRCPQQRFERADGTVEKKAAMEDFGHGEMKLKFRIAKWAQQPLPSPGKSAPGRG